MQNLIGKQFLVNHPASDITYTIAGLTKNGDYKVSWLDGEANTSVTYTRLEVLKEINDGFWIITASQETKELNSTEHCEVCGKTQADCGC